MKAKITFALVISCIMLCLDSYSQGYQRPVVVQKTFGTTYTLDGIKLSPAELEEVVMHHPEALREMKVARKNMIPVTILSYAGGFLVGYPLGTAIGGGTPDWKMAGIGAGLLALTVPFSIGYNKHAQQAVALYNEGLPSSQTRCDQLNFRLGFSAGSLGLSMTF